MKTKLTELEGCALGLIWESGSCSIYAVRKVFMNSPNPYWSGSAGAIYPLVRRLEGRGLLGSREGYTGERRRILYVLTAAGLRSLRAWLGPRLPDWSVTIPVDPLRARIRFLGALKRQERAAFLANAERQLVAQIKDARTKYRSHDPGQDPFRYLVPRGVAMIAQARLAWIREAARLLCPERKAQRTADG